MEGKAGDQYTIYNVMKNLFRFYAKKKILDFMTKKFFLDFMRK